MVNRCWKFLLWEFYKLILVVPIQKKDSTTWNHQPVSGETGGCPSRKRITWIPKTDAVSSCRQSLAATINHETATDYWWVHVDNQRDLPERVHVGCVRNMMWSLRVDFMTSQRRELVVMVVICHQRVVKGGARLKLWLHPGLVLRTKPQLEGDLISLTDGDESINRY